MDSEDGIIIRSPLPGELGWIIQMHSQHCAEKFGWQGEFECVVAKIMVEYLSSKDPDKQACFIAEMNGKPVGCIMLMRKNDTEGKMRVMYVSEDARRKGVGTLLAKALLEKAKSIGYKTLGLLTTDKQIAARKLYKKIGFSLVSSTPNTTFAKDSTDELWQMEL